MHHNLPTQIIRYLDRKLLFRWDKREEPWDGRDQSTEERVEWLQINNKKRREKWKLAEEWELEKWRGIGEQESEGGDQRKKEKEDGSGSRKINVRE